jgi:hypothetical protein
MEDKYSFDEFKLMYESTEKVVDRRLTNNKQNYTLSVAIVIGIAITWKWCTENPQYFFGGLLLVFIVSIFAILFCSLWIEQIKDFKKLNDAKFFVINDMAKKLYFESKDDAITVISCDPFTKEWNKLQEINALEVNPTIRLNALKSSRSEFFIPWAFRALFFFTAALSLFVSGYNSHSTWLSIQKLLHIQ